MKSKPKILGKWSYNQVYMQILFFSRGWFWEGILSKSHMGLGHTHMLFKSTLMILTVNFLWFIETIIKKWEKWNLSIEWKFVCCNINVFGKHINQFFMNKMFEVDCLDEFSKSENFKTMKVDPRRAHKKLGQNHLKETLKDSNPNFTINQPKWRKKPMGYITLETHTKTKIHSSQGTGDLERALCTTEV